MTYYEEDANHEARPIHPGDLLGPYRVIARKGGGAHGTVYQVEHVILGKRFALKQLQASVAQNETIEQRFLREARLLAMLEHPNIVQIVDCQRDPQYGLFLVLEWLHGCTLEDVLKRGRLTGREVRIIFRQLCWALELAQSYGIVHRDIKPANIFLQKHFNAFRIKLMDFGVSTASGGGTGELTMAGQMLGSAPYMPPEQVRGDIASIDGRSDIYSCGILLAETLTGKPPFTGPMPSLLFKHLQDPPPPLRQLAPDIRWNDHLEAIYQKTLAKTNDQRFSTPLEFWFALREALVGSALGQGTIEDGVVMRTLTEIFQKTDDAQAKRQLHASYFWGDNEISDESSEYVSPSSADLISVAAAFQPKEDRTGGDLAILSSQDDLPTQGIPLPLHQRTTPPNNEAHDHLTPPPPPPLPAHLLAQHVTSGSSSFTPLPDPQQSDSFPRPASQQTSSSFVPLQEPQRPNSLPQQPIAQRNPAAFARSPQHTPSPLSAPQTPQQGNTPFHTTTPPSTPAPTHQHAMRSSSFASLQDTATHYTSPATPPESSSQPSAPFSHASPPSASQSTKRSSYSSAQDRPSATHTPQTHTHNATQTGTHNIPRPEAFSTQHTTPQNPQRTSTPPMSHTFSAPTNVPTAPYTYPPPQAPAPANAPRKSPTGSHAPLPPSQPFAQQPFAQPFAQPPTQQPFAQPFAQPPTQQPFAQPFAQPPIPQPSAQPPTPQSAAQPPIPQPFASSPAQKSNPYAESDALLADLVDDSDYYDDNDDEGDATMLAPQGGEMYPPRPAPPSFSQPPRPSPPSFSSPNSAKSPPKSATNSPTIKPPPPPPPPPPSSALSRVGTQDKKKP